MSAKFHIETRECASCIPEGVDPFRIENISSRKMTNEKKDSLCSIRSPSRIISSNCSGNSWFQAESILNK